MKSQADKIRCNLIDCMDYHECEECMKEHLTSECPKGYFILVHGRNEEVTGDWEAPIIYPKENENNV